MVKTDTFGQKIVNIALLAICCLSPALETAAQGLENGDFESPGQQGAAAAGWVVSSGALQLDAQKRAHGQFAGKLDGGNGSGSAYQDVAVTPGETYSLTGLWRNGDKTAAFDVVTVEVRWLASLRGQDLGQAATHDSGAVVSQWTPFEIGPLTAPAHAGAARIRLGSRFGIAAFDALNWQAGSSAAAPLVAPEPSAPSLSAALSTPAPAAPALFWSSDLSAAMSAAAQQKRQILLFFFRSADEVSHYLETVLFADSGIQARLAQSYIAVRLDFDANRQLAEQLRIARPGTVVIYDASGTPLEKVDEKISIYNFERKLSRP